MFDRIATHLRLPAARLASLVLLLLTAAPAPAQAPAPIQPAQFDPSDVYFQGYLAIRAAEQLEASGDFVAAADKLEKARTSLEAVRRYYPAWKPEMVNGRTSQNAEAITKIRAKADEQRRKNQNVVAELEGGTKNSGTLPDPTDRVIPPSPSIREADPLTTRRLSPVCLRHPPAACRPLLPSVRRPPSSAAKPGHSQPRCRIICGLSVH